MQYNPIQFNSNNMLVIYCIAHMIQCNLSFLNKRYGHTAHNFSRLMSNVLIWEWFISISSEFQTTDNNTLLTISPADLIT